MTRYAAVVLSFLLLLATGCGTPAENIASRVKLDLDRRNERPFVEFYFAPYAAPGKSVYESGLIREQEGSFFLDLTILRSEHAWASELDAPASDGVITWDELGPFLQRHYYDIVAAPSSLSEFLDDSSLVDVDWLELEVDGVMTSATRHVLISESAVRRGLENYIENGGNLIYPVGTRIVADHVLSGAVAETSGMLKQPDGRWDFFVFDAEGQLSSETTTPPKNLSVPTQCAGCHFGSRLYEPEKSFPSEARPGPDGLRAVHVADRQKNIEIVRFLDEHRKRSDGILGIYGTIFLSDLVSMRESGTIKANDDALLDKLGL